MPSPSKIGPARRRAARSWPSGSAAEAAERRGCLVQRRQVGLVQHRQLGQRLAAVDRLAVDVAKVLLPARRLQSLGDQRRQTSEHVGLALRRIARFFQIVVVACCVHDGPIQIFTPLGAVKTSSTTLPVLRTAHGSKMMISASSAAAVRCSTPRGTTHRLAGSEVDDAVPELDAEAAAPDEEQLVLVVMVMPGEVALDLDELELLAVHLGHHLRPPKFGEARELLGDVDWVHVALPGSRLTKTLAD